ncbi:hypothetical protein [Micromonospora sp. NBS 11-29]|uniref:hypothetical protein n=1 Tax=Micromonospora sp. NBS 11-29 TaxID=1960879 RepID=UPI000B785FB4|nr:hypothetical protein [Micromonospora sp. NBS 11-29]
MTAFITSLGGRLAERWLQALLLPGVLFVGAVAVAGRLGHGRWSDVGDLAAAVDQLGAWATGRGNGAVALLAVAVVAGAVAAAALAQGLGRVVVLGWTTTWGPLGRLLVRRRRHRWRRAVDRYEEALRVKARLLLGVRPADPPPELPDTVALATARDRIALVEPRLPTWMGDRMHAVDERIRTAYDLDLASAWPRLWLTVAEEVRGALARAQAEFTAAGRLAGWGSLYLLLGLRWWPAAVVGVGAWALGWWRGRTSMENLAQLVEATVDLQASALAAALGHPVDGCFTPDDGEVVTRILRKGT